MPASIKPLPLRPPSLLPVVIVGERSRGKWETGHNTYVGTAGAMLDCVPAAGLAPTMSSFSRMVFSPEMILWVAMVLLAGLFE